MNTIDESVWDTLKRDLLAVWEKMRQVLWPKYLLGGVLAREGGGMQDLRSVEGLRRVVGRWPDAEAVLEGGMSEGLRDWDLWYVSAIARSWSANSVRTLCGVDVEVIGCGTNVVISGDRCCFVLCSRHCCP